MTNLTTQSAAARQRRFAARKATIPAAHTSPTWRLGASRRHELLTHLDFPDQDLTVCGCICHADCALSVGGEPSDWSQRCTCNATLKMRNDRDDLARRPEGINLVSTLGTIIDQTRRQRRARQAAKTRGRDYSDTRISAIIDEEWARQKLDPPKPLAKQRLIDEILQPLSRTERSRHTAESIRDLVGLPTRLRRATRGGLGALVPGSDLGPVYTIATGGDTAEVTPDPDGAAEIERIVSEATLAPSSFRSTQAELRAGPDRQVGVWGHSGPP